MKAASEAWERANPAAYDGAITRYRELLRRFPDSPEADRARAEEQRREAEARLEEARARLEEADHYEIRESRISPKLSLPKETSASAIPSFGSPGKRAISTEWSDDG